MKDLARFSSVEYIWRMKNRLSMRDLDYIYTHWTAILAFIPYGVKRLSGGNNSINSIDCQTRLLSQIIVGFYIRYTTISVVSTKALRYNLLVSIYTMFALECRFLLLVFTTASFKYLLSSSSSGNDSLVHRYLCSIHSLLTISLNFYICWRSRWIVSAHMIHVYVYVVDTQFVIYWYVESKRFVVGV